MSQHDLDIANQGFPATRADLNNALKALGSSNSGATAPSTTYANQLWYDTANNIIKIRNEDNDAWISLFTLDQTNDNIEALTVNGTITADALTVDTNTLVVDAANNHVGVGTASPSLPLHINGASAGDGLVYSRSGTEYFRIDDTGTDMNLKTTGGGHQVIFTTNGSEVGRWLNGGGLTFNGDTAAANALDDYEEGVAGVSFSALGGGSVSVDTTSNAVGYTKIGRKVHIQGEIRVNSVSSPSGFMALNNLPFVSSTGGAELSDRVYCSLLWYDASAATYNNIGGTLVANSQQMTLTGESGGSFQFGAGDTITLGFSYNTQ